MKGPFFPCLFCVCEIMDVYLTLLHSSTITLSFNYFYFVTESLIYHSIKGANAMFNLWFFLITIFFTNSLAILPLSFLKNQYSVSPSFRVEVFSPYKVYMRVSFLMWFTVSKLRVNWRWLITAKFSELSAFPLSHHS